MPRLNCGEARARTHAAIQEGNSADLRAARLTPCPFCASSSAKILQINISKGGLPKTAIPVATVGKLGIAGDEHQYKCHGGPRKALLLIAAETIDTLRVEGWPVYYGALGENLTTLGLDPRAWRPGQRYRVGSVLLELTTPREPCSKLDPYGKRLRSRIWDPRVRDLDTTSRYWGESGFYASVLERGNFEKEAIIQLIGSVP